MKPHHVLVFLGVIFALFVGLAAVGIFAANKNRDLQSRITELEARVDLLRIDDKHEFKLLHGIQNLLASWGWEFNESFGTYHLDKAKAKAKFGEAPLGEPKPVPEKGK